MTAMRGTWVLAVLAAGVAACSGGNGNGKDKVTETSAQPVTAPPRIPAPEPEAAGPTCTEMAAHVIETIASGPAMTEVVRKRCEEDGWTADNRRCMAGAATRDDAKKCFAQLTPAQREAMDRAEAELRRAAKGGAPGTADVAPAASLAPPPPAPPPAPGRAPEREKAKQRSRGAAPKPDSARSDPCEGGE